MGGSASHEFHLENSMGQDVIYFCTTCSTGQNQELIVPPPDDQGASKRDIGEAGKCKLCQGDMSPLRTMEIAHTFLLGEIYSRAFGATILNAKEGKMGGADKNFFFKRIAQLTNGLLRRGRDTTDRRQC